MKPRDPKKKPTKKPEQKPKQDDALDQALRDSFPASDPISLTEPAPKHDPTRERKSPQQEAPPPVEGP